MSIILIVVGLILIAVGTQTKDRGGRIVFLAVGGALVGFALWALTHGGLSFT